ncbi:GWxTD domain-containing protein [Hymenobacter sp. HSC-4F20]|uniref:GWxTD domain-containing protein n=1 Tax=Hymenobacter sp. HSC-4F20 TaxID=2864135 RepID=UPI001C72F6E1|nr:GWxTD domain-containing protein [Hymenobacter sp. HSC-4F20]MBX0291046.1 GWxTD domain-containing protein [Hymenobacter sp. HSC-4F20]
MKPFYLLLVVLLGLGSSLCLQAAPRRDFATQYRPERRIIVDTRREGDSVRLYLRFPSRALIRRGFPLHVALWADYDAKRTIWQDTVWQFTRRLRQDGEGIRLDFCLPAQRLRAGQVLSLAAGPADEAASGEAAWLRLTPEHLSRSFILTDSVGQPLLRHYVRAGEPFMLDCYGADLNVHAYRYPLSSLAAAPPMTSPGAMPTQPRKLSVQDSVLYRAGSLLRFQPGLYLLRVREGEPRSGLLVEENTFPALTSADELIAPLIYLTTSVERKKLFDAPEPKKAVDQFWLTVAGNNQTIARQLIRTYYGRVQEANQFFSAHKAGWLSDRGLLYLVLGPPESVYRESGEERWVYRADQGRGGTFVFRAKPSTFAPDNYELVRRPEYEQLWYAAVEQWRKGRTARPGR